MKQLTIEQKAQRYDEAIERAKEQSSKYCLDKIVIEEIFPELIEDKDEKIKKALLEMVHDTPNNLTWSDYGIRKKDAIAWLEKQGEQKSDTDFSDLRTWKYIVDAVLTEKDGIGQYLDSPFTEEVAKKLQKRFGNIGQKSADEVEPKFNVGDWIVNEFGGVWHIDSFDNKIYQLSDKIGNYKYYHYIPISKQDEMRLWTIQDAKDGDVLAYNDGSLAIFRYRLSGLDAGHYMSHFILTDKIEFKQTCTIYNVHPATKEQRITLFKAMHKAGYEWDDKKKELKKVIPL